MKTKLVFSVAILALIAIASMVTAIEDNSVTIGISSDGTASGTPEANVKVDLVGTSNTYSATSYTDSDGKSVFPNVPDGIYELFFNNELVDTIEKNGIAPMDWYEKNGIAPMGS